MNFPDSYFEDEVRDGFYVPGMMKRSWAAQLEMLDAIQNVCEKHQIAYFAEWGTLLGAVRHGGMIPWDDDIDICMKREDYEKFLVAAEDELPDGYWIKCYRLDGDTGNLLTNVVNYPELMIREKDLPRYHGYPCIEMIDLFVLDFLPVNEADQHTLWQLVNAVVWLIYYADPDDRESSEVQTAIRSVENLCGTVFDRKRPMKPQIFRALENVAVRFREENCEEITGLNYYRNSKAYRFPKSYYKQTMQVPFENIELTVPVEYEKLLTQKYGKFMDPVRQFDSHQYPAYAKVQEDIKAQMSIEPYQYKFSRQEMETAEGERHPRETLQKKVQDFLPLFQEAHEGIRQLLAAGDGDSAAELLGECQNVAIQIGTMIEDQCGEGHATVSMLERYCESVFHLHEIVSGESGLTEAERTQTIFGELKEFEEKLAESVAGDLKEKKEIVFVPYKTAYWGAMESVWQAAMAEEDTEVYVIPAPYYYKDDFGKIKKDEPHYETDYPGEVILTSYEDYNFEVHHPDRIVIQCPYDEYSYGMTIHPFFYATNLIKYTDRLVYIPPLVMDEIQNGDERGRVTLRYFCNMPGVVHADQVIVQSEQMKDVYVELLTEFAGEETRAMWEEKIQGLGSPVQDQEGRDPFTANNVAGQLPEEWRARIWRPDGSRKKVILYSTSVSALFSHGEQMIRKMQEVFRLFQEEQEDIVMWWRPDPKVREVLRKTKPGVLQKYRDLVQEYRDAGWGIYDDTPERERAVRLCDAYYGDAGSTANMCRGQKKPVMFQDAAV